MSHSITDNAFLHTLFFNNIPLMDVRSPGEFKHGSFPWAYNMPLLNDGERMQVGICHKQYGASDAIRLGNQLIAGETLKKRSTAWLSFIKEHPHGYLYCFRGGARSHSVQAWLREQGTDYPVIRGGYKTMRRYLLDNLDRATDNFSFIIISGSTGSGKTDFINSLDNSIDLEGLANHRGSAFGSSARVQPTQINFENKLSVALLHARGLNMTTLFIEDESKLIGRCCLPLNLQKMLKKAPILLLDEPVDERVNTIFNQYFRQDLQYYCKLHGDEKGYGLFAAGLLNNLKQISRRLGGDKYREINKMMRQAIDNYRNKNDTTVFYLVIYELLINYYDPMYAHHLKRRDNPIVTRGNKQALFQWIMQNNVPENRPCHLTV